MAVWPSYSESPTEVADFSYFAARAGCLIYTHPLQRRTRSGSRTIDHSQEAADRMLDGQEENPLRRVFLLPAKKCFGAGDKISAHKKARG